MDVVTEIALACPVCGTRPRKIGKGAHGQRGPLKTCGHPECVAALRAQSNRVQTEDQPAGERPVDPALLRKEGPKTCPVCQGAKFFATFDGIAWEGCDHCHTSQPIPILRNGAVAAAQPQTKFCPLCGRDRLVAEFSWNATDMQPNRWCRTCTRNRLRQLRSAAKQGGRPRRSGAHPNAPVRDHCRCGEPIGPQPVIGKKLRWCARCRRSGKRRDAVAL
jgi:hypothetical protein